MRTARPDNDHVGTAHRSDPPPAHADAGANPSPERAGAVGGRRDEAPDPVAGGRHLGLLYLAGSDKAKMEQRRAMTTTKFTTASLSFRACCGRIGAVMDSPKVKELFVLLDHSES